MSDKDKDLHCSFCGKEKGEVDKLIAGTDGYICNECIELCHSMLEESHDESVTKVRQKMRRNYQLLTKFVLI